MTTTTSPPRNLVFKGRYAILDEHSLPGTSKHPSVTVDATRLQVIADNCNKRVKETGDEIPLVLGHTDDDAAEIAQPPIVGLAKNFALAPLFETGRQAIFSDFYFYEDSVEEARKYPRRSVELWASKNIIDPISLLAASTPERDLGLMKFQSQETPYQYSISEEDKMPADDMKTPDKGNSPLPPDALAQIISGLMQTDLFKKLEEMVNGMGEDKEGEDAQQGDEPQAPPEEQQPPMPPGKPDGKEAAKYNEPAPVRFDASMASGDNTYIPSMSNKKEKYAMADEDRVKYSKLENRANVLETEVKALKKLNDEIVVRYRKDAGNMLFKTLLSEGYELDKGDSDMLQNMLPENQLLHAEQIRRKYKKAPVTESDTLEEALKYSAEAAPQGVTSQEAVEKVVELASKKGISYSEAKDELFGKAK